MGSSASKLESQVAITTSHPLATSAVDIHYDHGDMVVTCALLGYQFYVRVPVLTFSDTFIFYDGPTEHYPVLMIILKIDLNEYAIKLPASLDESRGPLSHFVYSVSLLRDRFTFKMDVRCGSYRTEKVFEWRRTRGHELCLLNQRDRGWKLVMLPTIWRQAHEPQYEGYASDGAEIVALMGYGHDHHGRFALYGRAARGELGEAFKLMALASYLTVEHHDLRQRRYNVGLAYLALLI